MEDKKGLQHVVDEDEQDCSEGWDDPASVCWKLEQRKVIGTLAAILVTWDIKPAGGEDWQVPNRRSGSLIDEPKDIQVMLKMKS